MKAIDFPEKNNILSKPSNMTDDQCYALPVHQYVDDAGFPSIISVWEVTDEDLERIKASRRIYVNTIGETLSPFSLFTEGFKEDERWQHIFELGRQMLKGDMPSLLKESFNVHEAHHLMRCLGCYQHQSGVSRQSYYINAIAPRIKEVETQPNTI